MAKKNIQTLIFKEFQSLEGRCEALIKKAAEESIFLQKCLMKCQGATTNFPTKISGGQISYYIQQYAEAILDFTFHEENLLTDGEFPEKDSKERLAQIFDDLDKIRGMCDEVSPGHRAEELLGNEIAECLLWRRGALLYMYCSTVQEDADRLQRSMVEYRQNLQKGIHYLRGLFKIRDRVLTTAHVPGRQDTLDLLKMGIYSDTHLLALMYTGEMCQWFINSSQQLTDAEVNARSIGIETLTTYVNAIEKLPELAGWSTAKAKKILLELKT